MTGSGTFLPSLPSRTRFRCCPPCQSTSLDHPGTIDAGQPVLNFLSHLWGAVQDISLFSLFFHEIYSEPDLFHRRNPRFWRFVPAKKQRDICCFLLFSAVFGPTVAFREDDDSNYPGPATAREAGVTIPDP